MRLYRVEHGLDGMGPYQFTHVDDNEDPRESLVGHMGWAHNDCYRQDVRVTHPGPHEDGLGYMSGDNHDWLFACTSIETLHQWFANFGTDLRDTGYVVSVIEADDDYVKVGNTKRQAIYDPDYATVVGTRKIGWL